MEGTKKMEPDSSWRCTGIGQEVADNLEREIPTTHKENISYFESGHIAEGIAQTDCGISVLGDVQNSASS